MLWGDSYIGAIETETIRGEETTRRRFEGDGFMRPLGCARSSKVLANIRMTCAHIREPVVNGRRLVKEPLVRRTSELGVT